MRSGCTLQYDLMRAQKEGKLESDELGAKDGKMKGLKDELLVFEQFRERVGKSLQQLSVSHSSVPLERGTDDTKLRIVDQQANARASPYLFRQHQGSSFFKALRSRKFDAFSPRRAPQRSKPSNRTTQKRR